MDEIKTKKCSHCGRELPVEMFHKAASSPDGYQYICKICNLEMAKERRARKKERASELAFKVASIPGGENIDKITLSDGKTFRKVDKPAGECDLEQFTAMQLLKELKSRGYVWDRMYVRKFVEYSKI